MEPVALAMRDWAREQVLFDQSLSRCATGHANKSCSTGRSRDARLAREQILRGRGLATCHGQPPLDRAVQLRIAATKARTRGLSRSSPG